MSPISTAPNPALIRLTPEQLARYKRHLLMKEIGGPGQVRLLQSRVLVIGAGGIGAPVLYYLAAAGIGTLGIVDNDRVDLSNLQRQIIHRVEDVGRLKVDSAADAIARLNPDVAVIRHALRLDAETAASLVLDYDLVIDGSDNFATRYAVADACAAAGKPLVSAAIQQFDGQLTTFKPYLGAPHPSYRCLNPAPPQGDAAPACEDLGVLGALPGILGAWAASEAVKELLGFGDSLSGRLLLVDALAADVRTIRLKRRLDG